jgi:hypothetical protein
MSVLYQSPVCSVSSCVGLREYLSSDLDKYHCPRCEPLYGPSLRKCDHCINYRAEEFFLVARCVIMMQKPLSLLLVMPLPLNRIAQPLQNLHIEMASNSLSRWYELTVHQTVDVKEGN